MSKKEISIGAIERKFGGVAFLAKVDDGWIYTAIVFPDGRLNYQFTSPFTMETEPIADIDAKVADHVARIREKITPIADAMSEDA